MKKPIMYMLLSMVCLSGCTTTTHSEVQLTKTQEKDIHNAILQEEEPLPTGVETVIVEEHKVLKIIEEKERTIVYARVLCEQYNRELQLESGYQAPVRITYTKKDGVLKVVDYWFPSDGTLYESLIRKVFPNDIVEEAFEVDGFNKITEKEQMKKVKKAFEEKDKALG